MNVISPWVQEKKSTPPFLIAGRLAMLAMALCSASFLDNFTDDNVADWVFISLGLLFGGNLLLFFWFHRAPESLWLNRIQIFVDMGIVAGVIFCTGGLSSPYLFLYLPVLFLTRIAGSFQNSLSAAFLAVTSYFLAAVFGSNDHLNQQLFLQTLIAQVIILTASISLVILSAQYLMLMISNKEAEVKKSALDLLEYNKDQNLLLEKLPYGVISLSHELQIKNANRKAASLLKCDISDLSGQFLNEVISEFSATKISVSKEHGKLSLKGLPPGIFSYEFLDASAGSQQQRFFIFQEAQGNSAQQDPKLLKLEDRLKELLSGKTTHSDSIDSVFSRNFIAESIIMKKVFSLIERAAPSDATVLIQGESGTGKELVARALHENGTRACNPFVTVNCGAIPESLIESTLFGHKKGSFTSAVSEAKGLIREAEGGTLFLDEIGELPLHMQAKLLRVLQERTLRPVGGDRDYEVDVRIVAATNKNLKAAMSEGTFRDDLFYRLNVINIPLPALRERKEDLPVLIHTFLKRLSEKESKNPEVKIASDAMHLLLNYDYPGNVRELENILERSYVLGSGSILVEHLSDLIPQKTPGQQKSVETEIVESDDLILPLSLDEVLNGLEKKCIMLALEKTQGHRTKAAELLGINLRSFRYRAQKLGL